MRAPASLPPALPTVLGALLLATVASGCGTTSAAPVGTSGTSTDKATTECRTEWKALADSLAGHENGTFASDLSERWNSVIATAQYYTSSARPDDCNETLGQMNESIAAIEDLSTKLRPYDVAYALGSLVASGTDYLATPLPRARKVKGKTYQPPAKKQVALALRILKTSARESVTDMADGWDEANTVDLTDAAATAKVVKDLDFLASDSAPFQQSVSALNVLRQAEAFSA